MPEQSEALKKKYGKKSAAKIYNSLHPDRPISPAHPHGGPRKSPLPKGRKPNPLSLRLKKKSS